jgi:hypothetical protein
MLLIALIVTFATIAAYIAKRKNRSVLGWFIFGGALAIVALPIIILIDPLKPVDETAPLPVGEKPKFSYTGIAVLVVILAIGYATI